MIYLDSCAVVKLIREEAESVALQNWLDARREELLVTSELALAEVLRVVRRNNHDSQGVLLDRELLATELDTAREVLGGLALVTLDRGVLERSGALAAPMVRTLDSIHLVSVLEWGLDSAIFVTYDRRLAAAAVAAGTVVVSPS